ncbi:MAG: hypothetical protein ACRD6N_11895, partial [Pyrinomonadaceae bacterium]
MGQIHQSPRDPALSFTNLTNYWATHNRYTWLKELRGTSPVREVNEYALSARLSIQSPVCSFRFFTCHCINRVISLQRPDGFLHSLRQDHIILSLK